MPEVIASSPKSLVRDTADMRWQVAADWEEALLDAEGLRLDEWLAAGRARVVKQNPGRTIYRIDLPAKTLFLKHYQGDWLERLRQWFRTSTARREWLKTAELSRRNVPTVRPVALGEPRRPTWVREQFFLTEAIPNAISAGEALAISRGPNSQRSAKWRRQLIVALARFVAAAHHSGVLHDDLHTGNILVGTGADGQPRPYLIDLPKVRFGGPLGWPASRDNLAMLYSGNLWQLSRTEQVRAWRVYRECRPELKIADSLEAGQDIVRRAWAHARYTAHGRNRRPLRFNREFYHQHLPAGVGYAVREVAAETLGRSIENAADLLNAGLGRSHKLTHGSVVVQTQLDLRDGPVEIALKRYRPRNWRKLLQALWRPSRARESFVRGHALLARGIPTPKPLMAVAPNGWKHVGESYLATTWIQGALNLHLYAWRLGEASAAERRTRCRLAARNLGQMVGRLHAWRISHHDLKGCNVLLTDRGADVEVYLIDLDGIRWHRRLSERKVIDNLARLAVSASAHPWIGRGDQLRFLRAYLFHAQRSRAEWKSLWRAAAARSAEIADRLRREEGPLA